MAIAETVSLPILLILLIFIFRSAVAALLPLAVSTWPSWAPSSRPA